MAETVLITGASRGIGLEFVRQYAEDGARVIACCRTPERAQDLAALAARNGHIDVQALDVTDHARIEALAQALRGTAIDVLVNNAGISGGREQALGSLDYGKWREALETNLLAPVKMAEAFADHVARSRRKVIANISSMLGSIERASGQRVIYRSSKAALNMATKCLAGDLAGRDVTVVAFHPGHVRTDMGGPSAPVTPHDSVHGLRTVIAGLDTAQSGRFLNYDGTPIPW